MTTVGGARPDLAAHERATRIALPEAVAEATRLLGPKLVAYICRVGETRAVLQWSRGERVPRDPIPARIRLALQVANLIASHDNERVAQAWFQGLNPQLDDRSPATLLREDDVEKVGPQIMAAARAFVVGG